jgi:hypothetical protein
MKGRVIGIKLPNDWNICFRLDEIGRLTYNENPWLLRWLTVISAKGVGVM